MKVIKVTEFILMCHECFELETTVINVTDTYRNLCKDCIKKAAELLSEK